MTEVETPQTADESSLERVRHHVRGHDGRKWRTVPDAPPCKHCGATPIAARSVSGWSLACPNDKTHGYLFEQWLEKCRRRWTMIHAA